MIGPIVENVAGRCACCDGTGKVEASTGKMRPCSRCQSGAFSDWYGALPDSEHGKRKSALAGVA